MGMLKTRYIRWFLDIQYSSLKGAGAGAFAVDDAINEGFCFGMNSMSSQDLFGRVTHDFRVNFFYT